MAQFAHQGQIARVVVVLGLVVADDTEVLRLGHVHGDVGQLQELVDVGPVVGRHHIPDAGLHREWEAADADLVLDDLTQTAEDLLGLGHIGQQDPEFVAAQPGQGVEAPEVGGHPGAQGGEQPVAVVVAQGVVDLFEPVEVDDGDGGGLTASRPRA